MSTSMLGLLLILTMAAAAQPTTLYVAPDGSDDNPGTAAAPFATVAKARDAVRGLVRDGLDSDVVVLVRAGTYYLDEPLVFGPEDSGTGEHAVTYGAYPGETPVISGGRAITGWKEAGAGKWQVELPEVKAGAWRFRQLFADGQRLPRGRCPNGDGLLRVKSVSGDVTEIVLDTSPSAADLAGMDAELVVYNNWSISRVRVVASDGPKLKTANPVGWIGHGAATTASPNKPCRVENALEFVDEAGEWYLERRSGVLTYMAAEGEDPNDRQFVAPRLEHLVIAKGRPDAPVRHVRFRGLAFEHAEWPLPEFGYLGIQAGHHGTHIKKPTYVLPLALGFVRAEDCALEDCRVAHIGATAVGFGAACRRNRVEGCHIEDVGGNGIMVGWRSDYGGVPVVGAGGHSRSPNLAADWDDPADAPSHNVVANCVLRDCAAVNHGCVAIYDAFCAGTRIAHNLVHDMPYTGISVGFRWDMSETTQRDAAIEYNHVHDVMKKLADGGCIYTLGWQPGTVLRGNLLHDVHRSGFAHGGAPNNGIFFDQGSKGYFVEGNIIYNTSGKPIRFNQTGEEHLTWQDNHFGVAPDDPAFPTEAARKAGPEQQ